MGPRSRRRARTLAPSPAGACGLTGMGTVGPCPSNLDTGFLIIFQVIFREVLSQGGLPAAAIRSDCVFAQKTPQAQNPIHHKRDFSVAFYFLSEMFLFRH